MSPHETLFRLEATQGLERSIVDHTKLCRFTVYDFPGDYYGDDDDDENEDNEGHPQDGTANSDDGESENENRHQQADDAGMAATTTTSTAASKTTPSSVFAGSTSLIFVVDAQDEPYDHVLQSFTQAVTKALQVNPNIAVEVFINKVDGELFLSDESKYDCRRDVMTQVTDELTDAGVSPDSVQIRFHLTSIYDHSVYEALSRVVQRLIAQLPTLENLLNVLVSTCSMEKAYLFDVVSKLYISTDSGPVDMQSVELCSDMIDVVLDVSGIYGLGPSHDTIVAHANRKNGSSNGKNTNDATSGTVASGITSKKSTAHHEIHGAGGRKGASGVDATGGEELVGTLISQAPVEDLEQEMVDADSAYDSESASVIRLSNGMVLYLKEVDHMLALVCITHSENFRKKSLINYNIGCLKKALRALVQPPPPSSSPATDGGNDARRVSE